MCLTDRNVTSRYKSPLRAAHHAGCLVPLQQGHHRRGDLQQPSDEHHQDTHCRHGHRGQPGLCGDQTNVQMYSTDENYKGEVYHISHYLSRILVSKTVF